MADTRTAAYDNYAEASLAIACGDTDNPRNPFRYGVVGRERDRTVAPYAGSRWAWLAGPCATWLGRSTERYTGPWTTRTAHSVLVIGTRHDPATPYENAVEVARLLPHSALLTFDGVGHTSLGDPCTTAVTARYLLTGATPPPGRVCTQTLRPLDPPTRASTALAQAQARVARGVGPIGPAEHVGPGVFVVSIEIVTLMLRKPVGARNRRSRTRGGGSGAVGEVM